APVPARVAVPVWVRVAAAADPAVRARVPAARAVARVRRARADPEVPVGGDTAARRRAAHPAELGRAASVPVRGVVVVPVPVGAGAEPARLGRSAEPVGGRLGGARVRSSDVRNSTTCPPPRSVACRYLAAT